MNLRQTLITVYDFVFDFYSYIIYMWYFQFALRKPDQSKGSELLPPKLCMYIQTQTESSTKMNQNFMVIHLKYISSDQSGWPTYQIYREVRHFSNIYISFTETLLYWFQNLPCSTYSRCGSTVHWRCSTVNGETEHVSLLFTCTKWQLQIETVLTDVLISLCCSMRHIHSISGQWKIVECFWVDVPTCMHCQVLDWSAAAVGFHFEDPCDFMFFICSFFPSTSSVLCFPLLVRTHGIRKLCVCWVRHRLCHADINQQCEMNWTHL